MTTRDRANDSGLNAFDVVKIVGIIVLALVVIRVIGAVIGAVMSVIWTVAIAAIVVGGLWLAWSVHSRGKNRA